LLDQRASVAFGIGAGVRARDRAEVVEPAHGSSRYRSWPL
jgi:hypothetical protein